MTEQTNRQPARDPQDLERLLIDRQHAGDVDGMVALFEPHAVVDCGEGKFLHAPRTGRDVTVSSLEGGYWGAKFLQARRVAGS